MNTNFMLKHSTDNNSINNNSGNILYVLAEPADFFMVYAVYTSIPTPTELQQMANNIGLSFTEFHDDLYVYEIPVGALMDNSYAFPEHEIVNWVVI